MKKLSGNRSVFIATPSYDGNVCAEYSNSLRRSDRLCWEQGIETLEAGHTVIGHSLIEDARNWLFTMFLRSQATDLFWLDADGGWDPEGFMKVLLSPKPFIAGVLPRKDGSGSFPVKLVAGYDGLPIVDTDGTIKTSHIGMAFCRMTREVAEKIAEAYPQRYEEPVYGSTYHLFERSPNGKGVPWGEDYTFCNKWRAIGGKIWVVPDIDFVHVGRKVYSANFHEYLRKQPGGDLAPQDLDSITRLMEKAILEQNQEPIRKTDELQEVSLGAQIRMMQERAYVEDVG